jgi:hypothetical protein
VGGARRVVGNGTERLVDLVGEGCRHLPHQVDALHARQLLLAAAGAVALRFQAPIRLGEGDRALAHAFLESGIEGADLRLGGPPLAILRSQLAACEARLAGEDDRGHESQDHGGTWIVPEDAQVAVGNQDARQQRDDGDQNADRLRAGAPGEHGGDRK